MKKILNLVCCVLLFSNCTYEKHKEEGELIKPDFENIRTKFSDIFEDVKYIPLETNEMSFCLYICVYSATYNPEGEGN